MGHQFKENIIKMPNKWAREKISKVKVVMKLAGNSKPKEGGKCRYGILHKTGSTNPLNTRFSEVTKGLLII